LRENEGYTFATHMTGAVAPASFAWDSLGKAVGVPVPAIFTHEMKRPDGTPRLVVVHLLGWNDREVVVGVTYAPASIFDKMNVPKAVGDYGIILTSHSPPHRIFGGVVDPANPSRMTMRYEHDSKPGTFEFTLDDRDDLTAKVLDGPLVPPRRSRDPGPSAASAGTPAVDPNSPKSVCEAFVRRLLDGDADGALALSVGDADNAVRNFAGLVHELCRLEEAGNARFRLNERGTARDVFQLRPEMISEADVVPDGNAAVVRSPYRLLPPIRLRLATPGGWRVEAQFLYALDRASLKSGSFDAMAAWPAGVKFATDVRELTNDLLAGRIRTLAELRRVSKERKPTTFHFFDEPTTRANP
jgi:hypothetical protein